MYYVSVELVEENKLNLNIDTKWMAFEVQSAFKQAATQP